MSRNEIIEKLEKITSDKAWDESKVVYFFVQIRKILDHRKEDEKDLHNLRFYCDWVVHISKDRIDKNTVSILKDLEKDIKKQISTGGSGTSAAINFAYFDHLKPEIIELLTSENMSTNFIDKDWISIISNLVKVLENQPLVIDGRYGLNIKEIIFRPSNPRCVIMVVIFLEPLKGKSGKELYWFRLANVY